MLDLSSLDIVAGANQGAEIELRHPGNKKKTGIFISIIGVDSDKFRERSLEKRNRNLESLRSRDQKEVTAEELDQENVETLAFCTTGWRQGDKDVLLLEGKEIKFSVKAAKSLYKRFPWIAEQVDKEVGNRANFLKQ